MEREDGEYNDVPVGNKDFSFTNYKNNQADCKVNKNWVELHLWSNVL